MTITLADEVRKLISEREVLKNKLASSLLVLSDQELPLDDRWSAYCALVRGDVITKTDSCSDGFVDTLVKIYGTGVPEFCDDFDYERYQMVYFSDMPESFNTGWRETAKPKYTAESVVAWKERVLASGLAGFQFDW